MQYKWGSGESGQVWRGFPKKSDFTLLHNGITLGYREILEGISMNANLGAEDRLMRAAIGILVVIGVFISPPNMFTSPVLYYAMLVVGVMALINSVTGLCLIFRILGLNSCKGAKNQNAG